MFAKNLTITSILFFSIFLFAINPSTQLTEDEIRATIESDEVGHWAERFGSELWELGQKMTKSADIREEYTKFNAQVMRKDGNSLIKSIVENVGRMLESKMKAVQNVLERAEEVSEQFEFNDTEASNFTFYSSKYSNSTANNFSVRLDEISESAEENRWMYRPMYLDEDSHFFNISVNTNHSSVHVPTNVYDRSDSALEAIQWSEVLDEVYTDNYERDPALSWQYFCSETGVFRHYPAMSWTDLGIDMFDCRRRSWYIEAATCSKDIVILIDNSGSMTGFRNYIAKLTVMKIMDTLSNNDFLNIYNYSAEVHELVPCFEGRLVQATPENIEVFNEAMGELEPANYANLTLAFEKAFDLLEKYRDLRKCDESVQGCNQAIMLITDGVAENLTDVFQKYNWIQTSNETVQMPVRVFTYLMGLEVTRVQDIQQIACMNRGMYSHIKTMDEVSEDVLKYVNVIATPLVLQGEKHPPTWTHAFIDTTYTGTDDKDIRLMIAVGVPAFDKKINLQNDTKTANLLGVAGTDVPLEEIRKLSLPYKLGVNGYSFVVSNNGYVLLHPDLRPVFDHQLKKNYNSIDFSEVEQFNDDEKPREPSDLLLKLRTRVINAKEADSMINISIKFHYDDMRRVALVKQDYFFAPLPNTPFSLGVALPSDYGKTYIKVYNEISKNDNLKVSNSDFFVGQNWKVHPGWVYCKYHYLEGHEFETPESELLEFLPKLTSKTDAWPEQYEADPPKLDKDSYYCNKELVQLLVFDAKVTNSSYGVWEFGDELYITKLYNATLRFVATMSGLTRWQFIYGEIEVDDDKEFGDEHKEAVDETWYKSAVLQYLIDPNSFVFSVPHVGDANIDEEIQVTASLAIFPRDAALEAPSAVVGYQFSHLAMSKQFLEITSKTKCSDCMETCSTGYDCYVIDSNGYIIISNDTSIVGSFFGEVEGAVMQEMVDAEIFYKVDVYDLQGLCSVTIEESNDAISIRTPFKVLATVINFLFTEFIFYLSRINLYVDGAAIDAVEEGYDDQDPMDVDDNPLKQDLPAPPPVKRIPKGQTEEEAAYFSQPRPKKIITKHYSCDKKSELYVSNQDLFIKGAGVKGEGPRNCSRPYFVKRIPHSNLLLVVVNVNHQTCLKKLTIAPTNIEYEVTLPCRKVNMTDLDRRRLEDCFTSHPEEINVKYCGGMSTRLQFSILLGTLSVIFYLIVHFVE